MKGKAEWVSGAEVARRLGCSRAAVTLAFQSGLIDRNADKKYLWPTVKTQWDERVNWGQRRAFRMSWT